MKVIPLPNPETVNNKDLGIMCTAIQEVSGCHGLSCIDCVFFSTLSYIYNIKDAEVLLNENN